MNSSFPGSEASRSQRSQSFVRRSGVSNLTLSGKRLQNFLPLPVRWWVREKRRQIERLLLRVRLARSFDALRRVTPARGNYGLGCGQCVDRYYIERFLSGYVEEIRGRVLEFDDDRYTRKFGGPRVTRSDVLCHLQDNPQATIVADLASANQIPSCIFDCVICTQVLMYIYDIESAIYTLHRILKPGGTLLATVAGIAQIDSDAMKRGGDYWRFTTRSVRRLFEEVFPADNIKVEAHGNVLAAISFLHGLVVEDLRREELEFCDPDYELVIAVRVVKPHQ
jgi:SAM-dependent methyltransferase